MKTTANPLQDLFHQAEAADIRLTPGMAEGLARGNPRMIAYVADLIALRGRRPAIETRHDGGKLEPGKTYTVNENGPEQVLDRDGHAQQAGDGRPAVVTPKQPGFVQPSTATFQSHGTPATMYRQPRMDDTPGEPGTLAGPMPVMPKVNGVFPTDERRVPPEPSKARSATLGDARVPRNLPDTDGLLSPVQKAMVDNAILALGNTRFRDYVPHLQQMVKDGKIRIDPGLKKSKETKTAQTDFGGGRINLSPEIFEDLDSFPAGRVIGKIAENLAHEHAHVLQWNNPVKRTRQAFQEGYLPFSPYRRKDDNGEVWGPLEWEPHQIGYEVERAVTNDFKKNFVRGARELPMDPYFRRQGMSSPAELRQK